MTQLATTSTTISSAHVRAATDELFGRCPAPSTTTLPVSAPRAFELFAECGRVPEWLSIVRSAHVFDRDKAGRATRVSYLASVDRGLLGYTLRHTYDPDRLTAHFRTNVDAALSVVGSARFAALGSSACLMEYELSVRVPIAEAWADPFFDSHAGSAVVHAFRDFTKRGVH